MKTLLLMRHAKSSWKDESLPDHDRPLSKRGRRDAPAMGLKLRAEGLVPDVVIASSAQRARSTAEAVIDTSGFGGEVQVERRLYGTDADTYLEVIQSSPPEAATVLVIGHNPTLESLLEDLTGEAETLATGAIAHLNLPIAQWHQLNTTVAATLVALWRPRDIMP